MIQSASLPNTFDSSEGRKHHLYGQYSTPTGRQMLVTVPAVHSNLNRTSLFPISKYGKITGKAVHSNHFFITQSKLPYLDQPSPTGGFELELNGFSTPTVSIALEKELILSRTAHDYPSLKGSRSSRGLGPDGAFDLDSFRLCAAVNQAKILLQHQELPPLNPTTNKKIDQQKILIGFGGGAEGGGGPVGVELESNCSRTAVNKAKKKAAADLVYFQGRRCRVFLSARRCRVFLSARRCRVFLSARRCRVFLSARRC